MSVAVEDSDGAHDSGGVFVEELDGFDDDGACACDGVLWVELFELLSDIFESSGPGDFGALDASGDEEDHVGVEFECGGEAVDGVGLALGGHFFEPVGDDFFVCGGGAGEFVFLGLEIWGGVG